MFEPPPIYFEGKRYVLVHDLWAGLHEGRKLSASEALWQLERMLRDVNAHHALQQMHAELSGSYAGFASDAQLLQRIEQELSGPSGLGGYVLVECADFLPKPKRVVREESREEREVRRVDALLGQLGKGDLSHNSRDYLLVRAQEHEFVPERKRYEAVEKNEARKALAEMAQDTKRPVKQREALEALLKDFDRTPPNPHTELVLLRRYRLRVIAEAEAPAAITPSALRKLKDPHWIEVELLDDNGQPVPNQRVLLVHEDGSEKSLVSDVEGRVRWEPIAPGSVSVRLPDLDADLWQALGGPSAQPVQETTSYTQYIVKRGDNLSRIARAHGLKGWKKLWDDPKNEPLRKKRKDPNILRPGDIVMVPGKTVQEAVRAVDGVCKLRVAPPESIVLRVVLQDHNQLPFVDEPYRAEPVPGGGSFAPCEGVTDASGIAKLKLPPHVREVRVALTKRGLAWNFLVSGLPLDPDAGQGDAMSLATPEDIYATQLALNALGFPCGKPSGVVDARTRDALSLFLRETQDAPSQDASADPSRRDSKVMLADLPLSDLHDLYMA